MFFLRKRDAVYETGERWNWQFSCRPQESVCVSPPAKSLIRLTWFFFLLCKQLGPSLPPSPRYHQITQRIWDLNAAAPPPRLPGISSASPVTLARANRSTIEGVWPSPRRREEEEEGKKRKRRSSLFCPPPPCPDPPPSSLEPLMS